MEVLRWNGMFAGGDRRQRVLVGLVSTILAISSTFMQLGFAGIPLPNGMIVYVVVQLLPVVVTSLVLGTLAGTINGLVTGAIMYAHAVVMPLNFNELVLVTPLSSIILMGLCGFLSGMLFALFLRGNPSRRRCIFGVVLTCAIVSCVYSLGFAVNALLMMSQGEVTGLSGTEFAAVFDTSSIAVSERMSQSAMQAVADALLMAGCCGLTYVLAKRAVTLQDDIGMRGAFNISIFAVVTLAYLVTATLNYVSISVREWRRSEASVRSEVNYLCLQLENNATRAEAFARLAQSTGMVPRNMSDSDLSDYRMLSDPKGDVLRGYTMQETGTVALLSNGAVISTDDPRLQFGHTVDELLGSDVSAAINESLRTGEVQRIPYSGVLADPTEGVESSDVAQIAYLLAGQQGDYTVMIIEPSSMFYRNRPDLMKRETIMTFVLLLVVFAIVRRLLSLMIAARIDETNKTLRRITEGNLDERVNVGGTREFKALSSGINQTVDALKGWIAEAETRMDSELAAARAIQESTLPRTFPPFPEISEFDVYASMDPAREVGGDFYDFFLVDADKDTGMGKLGFVVADVSGKGVPASLFMMKAKALIRDNMENGMSLSESLANANRQLCEGNGADMFVTAWVGVLDYSTGHIDFVNAGHNPPLMCHDGTWQWIRLRSGMPLGLFDGLSYKTFSLDCAAGDKLLLYTDGVTEAFNVQEEQYGEERLQAVAEASTLLAPRGLLEAVRSDLASYVAGAEQSDDITILTLEVDSVPHLATFVSR